MSEFPKLLWSPAGTEITVHSAEAQAAALLDGYRLTAEPVAAELVPAGVVYEGDVIHDIIHHDEQEYGVAEEAKTTKRKKKAD